VTKINELRIPFAEWLYRMKEGDVPYQARALAVYAVAFKATSNEELACLVGMDTKGIADKTYNKWKRYLSDNGWVIVRQITIGRVTTIEVDPAFQEAPVTFTDLVRRNPRRFYDASHVTITGAPDVESTGEPGKSYGSGEQITGAVAVEITAETVQDAPASAPPCARDNTTPATKESPTGIVISQAKSTTTTSEQVASDGVGSGSELDTLNGTAVALTAFIVKHASVDENTARTMLRTNIQIFSADALMEAYAATTAEMATGMIARPYKYLIEAARGIKNGNGRGRGRQARTPQDADDAEAKQAWRRKVIADALKEPTT
jgi:hypothetical protein